MKKSQLSITMYLIFFLITVFIIGCAQTVPLQDAGQKQPIKNSEMLDGDDKFDVATQEVKYHGSSKGFLAKPSKEGVYPGIVMIHEWWGLNDNIKDMARQLAAEGYVVLAVDLYDGKVGSDQSEARDLSSKVRNDMDGVIGNMKAAVKHLKSLDNVDNDRIGSMGWCFGGQMSLQLALNEPLAATVIYYGSLETNASKLSSIKWPILGIFGDKDTSIPVETVKKFESALKEAGVENEIHIYEGVGHAFANPSGMSYAPEQTKDAWKKTVEFLDKNLKQNSSSESK